MRAIDYAVRLAEGNGATLVAASLISVPIKSHKQGARLEYIQQSKDFLEAVKWKASRLKSRTERYEIFTSDVIKSVELLIHDLQCDGIVLATGEKKTLLMQEHEIKHILAQPPASLVLVRFSEQVSGKTRMRTLLQAWLRGSWRKRRRDNNLQALDRAETDGPLWVRTEEYH